MPSEKQMLQDAKDEKDRQKAAKAYDKEMPEPDTTFGKLARKAAGAASVIPGAVVGGAYLGASPDGPGVLDSAKYGAKSMYHAMAGNKKEGDEALEEFKAATKRAQSVKTKRNTGETTNAMGDNYKKGGMTASKRADGCAVKGKTKGTMITMKGGGYAR
jgi:hypothetical protein